MISSALRPARPTVKLSRGQWTTDAAIAAAVTLIQVAGSYAAATAHPSHHLIAPQFGYALLAISGLALVARRRYPVAVLGVTLVTALTAAALGARVAYLALIVAFFTAVLARKRAAAIASLIIGYFGSILPGLISGSGPSLTFVFALLAWLLVLLCGAELLRLRNQRAADQVRAREEELTRLAMAERLAIARDLHDIVAHNISVINVQSNTALHLIDRQPERAREALTAIHEISKQALTELRSVLGVLRTAEDQPPLTPGPGIDQLDELAAKTSAAGVPVVITRSGNPRAVSAEVGVAAYRIAQEALTNTARHASGGRALVSLAYGDDVLVIEISDDGPPAREWARGNGITGMIERAQALGGRLEAGPRSDRGFRVQATLPLAGKP